MAGLNYFDDRNKYESNLLQTQYDTEVVGTYGNSDPTNVYKYTRTRTKTYSYLGMNKQTALSCMNAKMDLYDRTYYNWNYTNGKYVQDKTSKGMYKSRVANVQASKQEGTLWNVDIQVNEIAIIYHTGALPDLSAAFNFYVGNWSYDE